MIEILYNLYTVSQVVEGFKNVSEYTYLVAQKIIQTIGINNKSYGTSERGNYFLKEELPYFIYTTVFYIHRKILASHYPMGSMQMCPVCICSGRNFPISTFSSCSFEEVG